MGIIGGIVDKIKDTISKGSSSKGSSSSSKGSSSKGSSSSSKNSGSSSKKNPSETNKPPYYKPGPGEEKHEGTAVIKNPDGSVKEKFPTYIKDGAMYDKETGKIVSSSWGSQGMYGDPEDYEKSWDQDSKTGTWVEKEKPKKKPSGGGGGGGGRYYPPPKPSFIDFNEPVPTFKSDLKKVNKFTYFSGIDLIEAKRLETNPEVCFISKSVTVGTLKDNEHIEFDAKYFCDESSSIEFYIIDGEKEVPILPVSDTTIQNEKIFFEMDTRFSIDKEHPILIKQGTRATNLSFDEANKKPTDSKMENAYNITYTPKTSHKYKPFNQTIKIKVIIRSYAIGKYSPYIKSMKIKKYGGNALWSQNL